MIRKIIGWIGIIGFALIVVVLFAYTFANQLGLLFVEGLFISLIFWIIIIGIALFLAMCIEWIM